jgi:hypothetical protein
VSNANSRRLSSASWALCYIEQGRCRFILRNGNVLSRFIELAQPTLLPSPDHRTGPQITRAGGRFPASMFPPWCRNARAAVFVAGSRGGSPAYRSDPPRDGSSPSGSDRIVELNQIIQRDEAR